MDGRANPLMDRKAAEIFEWLQWSPHPQLQDVVRCSEVQCNCSCSCSCTCTCTCSCSCSCSCSWSVVDVVEVVEVV